MVIKSIFISLLILHQLSSCKKEVERTYVTPGSPSTVIPTNPTDTTPAKGYLALGDSYTIGQSVPAEDRYPVQAAKYLTAHGIRFDTPEIIAKTGWTTGNLLSKLAFAAPLKPSYDIVTLLIGVNNQYQRGTQQEYSDQFSTLLAMAVIYAGNNKKKVVVISIPDYSVTPFANGSDKALIAREIDSFNVINKTIAMQVGVNYLDITGSSRLAADDPSLIATDGLHPSGLEYKVWADELVPIIMKALE